MNDEVTLVIADDHPLLRQGLRNVMRQNPRFRIVGEASNGHEALQALALHKPRMVILDIDMPGMNGFEVVREIRELPFPVKVVVLTMYQEEEIFNEAMDLGARAYVLKDNAATDVIAALETVDQGGIFISATMHEAENARNERARHLHRSKPQIESLTPTERRILKLIGEDYNSKEIASLLHCSVKTVNNHRQHISEKLGLQGTHSLLKFAFENSSCL
jgi:DNA-binding NarL/FixJ family response regulator